MKGKSSGGVRQLRSIRSPFFFDRKRAVCVVFRRKTDGTFFWRRVQFLSRSQIMDGTISDVSVSCLETRSPAQINLSDQFVG